MEQSQIRCRISGLSYLAFEGRDGCCTDNDATFAIVVRIVQLHNSRSFLGDIEGADEVDLDNFIEQLARPRSFTAKRATRRGDARTIDRQRDAVHCLSGLFDRSFD